MRCWYRLFFCVLPAGSQEDGSAAADIGSVLQEEAGDPVELKIMYFFDLNTPGTHYHDLWEELAAEKGYKLKITPCSTEQIKDKLRTALACNELPDIFVLYYPVPGRGICSYILQSEPDEADGTGNAADVGRIGGTGRAGQRL